MNSSGQSAPSTPAPGWYPEPDVEGMERFWDGTGWTPDLRPREGSAALWKPDPVIAAGVLASAGSGSWRKDPNYAHPGWRIIARVIDFSLATLIGYGIAVLLLLPRNPDLLTLIGTWWQNLVQATGAGERVLMPWDVPALWSALVTIFLVDFAVKLIYNVTMLSVIGASPGRMVVKIRVVAGSNVYGRRLDPGRALGRQLLSQLFDLIPVLNIVNWLSPSWRPRRLAAHDSLSNTVVVKVR